MRKLSILAAAAAILTAAVWAGSAQAAHPHWVVDPYCTVNTSTNVIDCSGKAAGLGSLPIFVVMNVNGGCQNQDGTHVIPGRSRSVSGPFDTTNGSFAFGEESTTGNFHRVSGTAPTCTGASQISFVDSVTLSIYSCSSGQPTFNSKGRQTNDSCTKLLGPTAADLTFV